MNLKDFHQYTVLAQLVDGPDEELYLLCDDGDEKYYVKRYTEHYLGDADAVRKMRGDFDLFNAAKVPGSPICHELLDLGNESVSIYKASTGVNLQSIVDYAESTKVALSDELKHLIVENVTKLTLEVTEFNQAGASGEGDMMADFRPGALHFSQDLGCQFLMLSSRIPAQLFEGMGRTDSFRSYFMFASPEQVAPGGRIAWESCLYGLGSLLFEVLTGRALFNMTEKFEDYFIIRRKLDGINPWIEDCTGQPSEFDSPLSELLSINSERRIDAVAELHRLATATLTSEGRERAHDEWRSIVSRVDSYQDEGSIADDINQLGLLTEIRTSS